MKSFLFFIFFLLTGILYAQQDFECGMQPGYSETYPEGYRVNPPQIGGKHAPAKTLNGSYVRIFCVFAQFSGDTKDPNDENWTINQMPEWSNTFIGTNPNQAPFPENTISNYFHEMSNGQNIIIGYVHPQLVIINAPINQYYGTSNLAVLQEIDQSVNFQNFDQWNMPGVYEQYFNQTDNYVDAIYIIWRNIGPERNWGGIADLGLTVNPFVTNEGVKIDRRIPTISMTLNIGGKSDYTFPSKIGLLAHEYGHYLYGGGHNFENFSCGGSAQRGLGLMNAGSGGTLAMNPQEKYLLGYTTYTDIFYDQAGSLSDYQTSHVAYRFPIPLFINGIPNINPNEFFVIANHQKESIYEFTKTTGIYIYHVKNNFYGHNHMDMITADGLWQWSVINWITPVGLGGSSDWYCVNSPDQTPPAKLPIPKKVSVDREDGRDELQEVVRAQYPVPGPYYGNYYWWDKWYDENGDRVESPIGDAQDAYNIGYNQVFSPWSNPPTYDKNRTPIYAAMELINENNGIFNLQFYVGQNNCLATAPAKPQNFTPDFGGENPSFTWEANIETDLLGYRVYKELTTSSGTMTTYAFTTLTTYTDYDFTIGNKLSQDNAEYWVVAVDSTNKLSIETTHYNTNGTSFIQWKASNGNEVTHSVYRLNQNYPNPFNPTTTIAYSIQKDGLVSLKVYDVLGKEVASLVNEPKIAGTYNVEFSASFLPSGIYFYRIQAGTFVTTKKLILLK